MKKAILLLFALAVMSIQTMAQLKIDPKINPNGGIIHPALKKDIERRAAAQKILNATVSKVEFQMSKIPGAIGTTLALFKDRRINLKENNDGAFALKEKITGDPIRTFPNGKGKPFNESYSFTPGATTKYKDLLSNGFTVGVDFTQKYNQSEYSCDFQLIFYFTDGSKVSVALQEINVSKEGANVFLNDVHLSKKLPGSVFPDPENPVVLPPVK